MDSNKTVKTDAASPRKKLPLLLIIGCVFVVYGLVVAFAGPERVLGNYLVDDSLYYYGISQHVALGYGSVFDGVNQTNGYHPLWMLTLVPVYWIFSTNVYAGFTAAICLQAALFALVLSLLVKVAKFLALGTGSIAAVMLTVGSPLFFHLWVNGLESTLLGCFVLAALLQYMRIKSDPSRDTAFGRILLGGLCGLAFLSRLDSVFLPIVIILAEIIEFAFTRRFRGCFFRALSVGLMMLAIGGPYLLRNLKIFGHIMPVSGYMKTPGVSGSVARFGVDTGGVFWPAVKVAGITGLPAWLASAIMVIAIVGAIVLLRLAFKKLAWKISPAARKTFYVYLVYCAVHYSYVAIRMPQFCNTMWYYIPAILAVSLSMGIFITAFTKEGLGRFGAVIIMLLAVTFAASGGVYRLGRENSLYTARLDAAKWLAANMYGKTGAAFDAGIVGYFSGGNVINLDGLVNNLTLKEYADQGKLDQYLLDMKVDYVAQYLGSDGKGKRARWITDELGSVIGPRIYEKNFTSFSREMTMCVFEVRK